MGRTSSLGAGRAGAGRSVSPRYFGATEAATGDPGLLHPVRWPRLARILLCIASGLWLVTIPFMLSGGARRSWLPWLGIAAIILLALFIADGGLE